VNVCIKHVVQTYPAAGVASLDQALPYPGIICTSVFLQALAPLMEAKDGALTSAAPQFFTHPPPLHGDWSITETVESTVLGCYSTPPIVGGKRQKVSQEFKSSLLGSLLAAPQIH